MKKLKQTVVCLQKNEKPEKIIAAIESQVRKQWDTGWVFVHAEVDKLFESVCLYFEKEILVE